MEQGGGSKTLLGKIRPTALASLGLGAGNRSMLMLGASAAFSMSLGLLNPFISVHCILQCSKKTAAASY